MFQFITCTVLGTTLQLPGGLPENEQRKLDTEAHRSLCMHGTLCGTTDIKTAEYILCYDYYVCQCFKIHTQIHYQAIDRQYCNDRNRTAADVKTEATSGRAFKKQAILFLTTTAI